jgi:excisionase family DNA binding protein
MLMTTNEVAVMLRCSERNVRDLVAKGLLGARRVRSRGAWLIDRDAVMAALHQAGKAELRERPGRAGSKRDPTHPLSFRFSRRGGRRRRNACGNSTIPKKCWRITCVFHIRPH